MDDVEGDINREQLVAQIFQVPNEVLSDSSTVDDGVLTIATRNVVVVCHIYKSSAAI